MQRQFSALTLNVTDRLFCPRSEFINSGPQKMSTNSFISLSERRRRAKVKRWISPWPKASGQCTKVYQKFLDWVDNEINNNKLSLRSNTKDLVAELTRLTHKIAIQQHLMVESCTICSSRSRRPVRKLLITPSYRELGDKSACIFTIGTGGRWVVGFTIRSVCPRGKSSLCLLGKTGCVLIPSIVRAFRSVIFLFILHPGFKPSVVKKSKAWSVKMHLCSPV